MIPTKKPHFVAAQRRDFASLAAMTGGFAQA
jgi:hypothetical protein